MADQWDGRKYKKLTPGHDRFILEKRNAPAEGFRKVEGELGYLFYNGATYEHVYHITTLIVGKSSTQIVGDYFLHIPSEG